MHHPKFWIIEIQHPNARDTNYAKKYEYNARQKCIVYAKKNTKYAKQNTKYAKQNTKYANQNAKYAKQNTKCANSIKRVCQTNNYWFTLFCRDAIFVANLRTFLVYLLQAKKIWWRTENDKYEVCTHNNLWKYQAFRNGNLQIIFGYI